MCLFCVGEYHTQTTIGDGCTRCTISVVDENYGVAGTIDFVAKNGNEFEMYDWKRSLKVIDKITGNAITENR